MQSSGTDLLDRPKQRQRQSSEFFGGFETEPHITDLLQADSDRLIGMEADSGVNMRALRKRCRQEYGGL